MDGNIKVHLTDSKICLEVETNPGKTWIGIEPSYARFLANILISAANEIEGACPS